MVIVHGMRDEVVPIESSRRYVTGSPGVSIEVDDDHSLSASIDRVADAAIELFELANCKSESTK